MEASSLLREYRWSPNLFERYPRMVDTLCWLEKVHQNLGREYIRFGTVPPEGTDFVLHRAQILLLLVGDKISLSPDEIIMVAGVGYFLFRNLWIVLESKEFLWTPDVIAYLINQEHPAIEDIHRWQHTICRLTGWTLYDPPPYLSEGFLESLQPYEEIDTILASYFPLPVRNIIYRCLRGGPSFLGDHLYLVAWGRYVLSQRYVCSLEEEPK